MAYKQLKLWFDGVLAEQLSEKILQHYSDFDGRYFVKTISEEVDNFELKDRVALFAQKIHEQFDGNFELAQSVILKILGPENEAETGMFTDYYWIMPLAKYVEDYGLDYFEQSMKLIEEITKRNTGEYAIRPFIEKYPSKTMARMTRWSLDDDNKHIRRLASEGGRPRLPWASKMEMFVEDPAPLLPILENLKDDTSKYVQKSVGNCLNDIFKDNYSIARTLVEKWLPGATSQRKWIIKHGTRRLRKDDDKWALGLFS